MFNAISSDIKSQKDDLSSSPGSSVRIGVLGPREPLCDDSRSIDHLHQNTVRLYLLGGGGSLIQFANKSAAVLPVIESDTNIKVLCR